ASGSDEVGALSAAFRSMALKVRASHAALEAQADELAQSRDMALAAARSKAEFLAMMSHEIRTPLNGVIGMLGLLRSSEITTEQREFADTAQLSAEALLTLINDILDFSKVEAGKLELECVEFEPRRLVDESLTLLAERGRQKRLEL